MARGWESKAVEAQQADAAAATSGGPPISRDEANRRNHLATLTLARTRAAADLRAASAEPHRAMLARAIADLDKQIAGLG